jgi:hypothetical protein
MPSDSTPRATSALLQPDQVADSQAARQALICHELVDARFADRAQQQQRLLSQ